MSLKIHVTRQRIDESRARDSHHCMIADALKDAVPTAQYILVDTQSIRYTDSETKKRYMFLTPPLAQKNLLRFDRGDKTLGPFTFRLHKPVHVRKAGWVGQGHQTTRKGKKYKKTHLRVPMVAYKVREFGLRVFIEAKA